MSTPNTAPNHVAVWFEIPVSDIRRAHRFYSEALKLEIGAVQPCPSGVPDLEMAVFSHQDGAVAGALIKSAENRPSKDGTIAYLNAGADLQQTLDRLPGLGAEIIVPKTLIAPEIGYFALFRDSEGNTVGLHSQH
ncbi:MAG: VOC family protein [Moraxellaceae bacterium]